MKTAPIYERKTKPMLWERQVKKVIGVEMMIGREMSTREVGDVMKLIRKQLVDAQSILDGWLKKKSLGNCMMLRYASVVKGGVEDVEDRA